MKKYLLLSLLLAAITTQLCAQPTVKNKVYSYKNLSIYLLESNDQSSNQYLTLAEAMKQSKIELRETGTVSELSVDNLSNNPVFIMAGDIVKGGKQDRTIGIDLVLKPSAKKVPLKSFCVERSRWSQRGGESLAKFSTSAQTLSNRNLKIAAREKKDQSSVWEEVSAYQTNAGTNVNADVKSKQSATSLQLTLENKELRATVQDYIKALQSAFDNNKNAVGFAFCINGKISTVEWFENAQLFSKLHAKLFESAANEAVSEYSEDIVVDNLSAESVTAFIMNAQAGNTEDSRIADNMLERKYKTDKSTMFSSYNTEVSTTRPVHVSIYSTEGIESGQVQNQMQNQLPQNQIQLLNQSHIRKNR